MADFCIPIEPLSEDNSRGVVRDDGSPDLIAFRPEPSRYLRLARVIGAAKAIAANELGRDAAQAIVAAMISASDEKGDFTFVWRKSLFLPEYANILECALALENEAEIAHVLQG